MEVITNRAILTGYATKPRCRKIDFFYFQVKRYPQNYLPTLEEATELIKNEVASGCLKGFKNLAKIQLEVNEFTESGGCESHVLCGGKKIGVFYLNGQQAA